MLKQRLAAADAVATALKPAESAIEIAAIEATRVVTVMMEARRQAGLGRKIGNEAIVLAGRAAQLLIEAQRTIHDAHGALGPVIEQIGLGGREQMFGCEEPPADGLAPSFVRTLFAEAARDPASARVTTD